MPHDGAAADDLTQDVATKVLAAQGGFTPGTNFSAWVHRIMKNHFISGIRSRREFSDMENMPEVAVAPAHEDRINLRELNSAVSRLPDDQREALFMIVLHEKSYEAAAEMTGCAMVPDEAAPFPAAPTPSLVVLPQAAPSPLASAALPAAPQAAEPAADPSALLAPEAADAAASSMGKLIRALADQLTPQQVGSGGPTIEDIVREKIRPLLQAWLDANLPPQTEQVVREEIQRLADRAAH